MNDIEKVSEKVINPACSICEEEGQVVLTIEMPGVEKDGISIQIEKNELVISGKAPAAESEGIYLVRERRNGEFRKNFIIDESIDREKVKATIADGVLTLELSRKEAAKPRKIEIA